jgi:hypothetical protein
MRYRVLPALGIVAGGLAYPLPARDVFGAYDVASRAAFTRAVADIPAAVDAAQTTRSLATLSDNWDSDSGTIEHSAATSGSAGYRLFHGSSTHGHCARRICLASS